MESGNSAPVKPGASTKTNWPSIFEIKKKKRICSWWCAEKSSASIRSHEGTKQKMEVKKVCSLVQRKEAHASNFQKYSFL